MARLVLLLCVLALTIGTGCRRPAPPESPPAPEPAPPAETGDAGATGTLAERNTHFAFTLFDKLRADQPEDNLFISPLSVSMAIGMVYLGAATGTETAIAGAMQWSGMDAEQVNGELQKLRGDLQGADPQVKLTIADSLWTREGIEFHPEFLQAIEKLSDAQVKSLDFNDPDSADTINNWVDQQTNGLIPKITSAEDLAANLFAVLLDAVYFKGRWTDVFNENRTEDAVFTLLDGNEKTVPLMAQSGEYRYLQTDGFQAIRLPYGNERLGMLVFLPAESSSLGDFCASLDAEKWAGWLEQMSKQEGTIKLPRFTTQGEVKLKDALAALGMGEAFSEEEADFSAMSEEKMWIGMVKQKSFLKVDEEGTEAAAVTSVEMAGAAAPPPGEPFEMVVDRPFFLAIVDDHTGTILFMGAIVEPEEG